MDVDVTDVTPTSLNKEFSAMDLCNGKKNKLRISWSVSCFEDLRCLTAGALLEAGDNQSLK